MNRSLNLLRVTLAAVITTTAAQLALAADWARIDPVPVVGMDGKLHAPSCSGYPGTDPSFKFWARKTASKNLVVYFEGGGACWDSLTCTFPIDGRLPPQVPQFYVPQVAPNTDPASYDGIFRSNDVTNPVHDWNFVYIPYCTGDLHAGSATRTYANVGHPAFPLPATFDIQHRGFDNFMVVMDWVRKNFDAPKNVLVAGSSAGGYGAAINFPWVAKAYPQAHLSVLADASQGVTTAAWDKGTPGRGSWNMQFAPGAFGPDGNQLNSQDLLRAAAKSHPKVKVAQFTTQLDAVQVGFYGVMKTYYGPGGSCPNAAADWSQQMLGTLQSYNAEIGNFRSYLAAGIYHTNLRSPQFYTEASAGVAYSHWVETMLGNRGGTRGAGGGDWQDVACPGCQLALPCQ